MQVRYRVLAFMCLLVAAEAHTPESPAVRWTEGDPGSTLHVSADGKYTYSLRNRDLEIAVGVDSQELEKTRHRSLPIFALRIDARLVNKAPIQWTNQQITLQFLDHFQVINQRLDADELESRIQGDIDTLTEETARDSRKQPARKSAEEAALQVRLKELTDLAGFVSAHGINAAQLDQENPDIGGWIFFSAKNKWIGKWKPRENLVLRIPVDGIIFEFPFSLPPRNEKLLLRRRDNGN